jgi:3-oxoacyl-[acyl-carrier protein] reductase
MHFKDKVVFVTGGASGIGRQTCLDFAKHGAKIVVFDLADAGVNVAGEIEKSGGKAIFIKGNISKKEDVDKAVAKAFETFKTVDILINAAGILRDGMLHKLSEADWDLVIAVNLKGAFLVTQALAKKWIEICQANKKESIMDYPDRRIVSIASMAAEGNIGQTNYSASKAGLVGMTKTWAKELVRYNVRTHAVMPTLIDTPIIGDLLKKDDGKFEKMYKERIPFGIGKPNYVSDVILFLCSSDSVFMNGNVVQINGGKLGEL